jgi:hypothetical protein
MSNIEINEYDVGDVVRISGVFTENSVAKTPQVVHVEYKKPAGSVVVLILGTDAAVVEDSAGHIHADLEIDTVGTWYYKFEGLSTDNPAKKRGAGESAFVIKQGHF